MKRRQINGQSPSLVKAIGEEVDSPYKYGEFVAGLKSYLKSEKEKGLLKGSISGFTADLSAKRDLIRNALSDARKALENPDLDPATRTARSQELDQLEREMAQSQPNNVVPVAAEESQKKYFTPEVSQKELLSAVENGDLTVAFGDFHVGRTSSGASRQVGASEFRESTEALGNFLEDNRGKVSRVQITGDVVDSPGLGASQRRYQSVADRNTDRANYKGLSEVEIQQRVQSKTLEQAFSQVSRGSANGKPVKVDIFFGNHDGQRARELALKNLDGSSANFKLEGGRLPALVLRQSQGGQVVAFDPDKRVSLKAALIQEFGNDSAKAEKILKNYEARVQSKFTNLKSAQPSASDADLYKKALSRAREVSPEFSYTFVDPKSFEAFKKTESEAALKYKGQVEVNVVTRQDYDLHLTDVSGRKQLAGHNSVSFDGISSPNRDETKYVKDQLPDPRQQRRSDASQEIDLVQNSDKHEPHLVAGKNLNGSDDPFYSVSTPVFGAGVRGSNQPRSGLVVYGNVDRDGKKVLRPFYLETHEIDGEKTLVQSAYDTSSSKYVEPVRLPASNE